MNMTDYLTVAAYQGPIKEGEAEANLEKVLAVTEIAEQRGVDILSFPESYLHGYFPHKEAAMNHSIDLASDAFKKLCKRFAAFKTTTVLLGLNELVGNEIFNTVIVIENGLCIGKYRKAYTYVPYDYFSLGNEFPVFTKKGVRYGIIICLDSAYREPAHIAALKGARIIFCPSFNRVQKDARMLNYLHRKSHFIARAFDNHCWLVVSDIVWDAMDESCPGFSSIFSDDGELIARAEVFQETILQYSIPLKDLHARKKVRLFGKPELFSQITDAYAQAIKEDTEQN